MRVNKNSWHYKWLAFGSVMSVMFGYRGQAIRNMLDCGSSYVEIFEYFDMQPTNFCQYWRRTLLTLPIMALVNIAIVGAILALIVIFPVVAAYSLGITLGVIIFLVTIAALSIGTTEVVDRVKGKFSDENSIFANVYKSYKSNVCTMMEYKNDD